MSLTHWPKSRTGVEIGERVGRILDRLSLGTLADRLAPNLSGGQQQRVALARALVAQPQVLLLDEPLSNLDAKLREQMRFELKSLQESFGITTVYVTHDQEEALALSDRIGLMHEGMLLEVGSPTRAVSPTGTSNHRRFSRHGEFYRRQVEQPGNGAWDEMLLDTPVGRFAARRSVEWQPGMAAELFFRPESIELLDANRIDGLPNHGSARVERVTFLGNSADVILRSGEVRLRLRAHPARIPSVGTKVSFSVPRSRASSFRRED